MKPSSGPPGVSFTPVTTVFGPVVSNSRRRSPRTAFPSRARERVAPVLRDAEKMAGLVDYLARGDWSQYIVTTLHHLETFAKPERAAIAELQPPAAEHRSGRGAGPPSAARFSPRRSTSSDARRLRATPRQRPEFVVVTGATDGETGSGTFKCTRNYDRSQRGCGHPAVNPVLPEEPDAVCNDPHTQWVDTT